jgi:Contractile injection system tube protein
MSDLERAKLIPVSGTNDAPDMNSAIDVQFNPVSLRVSLSNTLKASQSQGNTRAAQFVDKSSSTLSVELVFDTTYIETTDSDGQDGDGGQDGSSQIEQGSDVRQQTRKIADKFLKPVESGSQMQAPSRVLFQWGSFEFIGMVQTYDETLDFFSEKGRPLRASVSLKLSEDRYQFRSSDSDALNAEQSPTLSFTGNSEGSAPDQSASPVPGGGGGGAGSWRANAMFNGIETPRLPTASMLAIPSVSMEAGIGFGISGGISVGINAGLSLSRGIAGDASPSTQPGSGGASAGSTGAGATSGAATGARTQASFVAPPFKYGNSAQLGTGVPGAFHPSPKRSLSAASLQQGSERLRPTTSGASSASRAGSTTGSPSGAPAVDARRAAAEQRTPRGVSVTLLLKGTDPNGVGFD